MVASRSTVTSPPSAPGRGVPGQRPGPLPGRRPGGPDGLQRPRQVPASRLTSRETTGSDATGPASSGCSRSTAISARQSPPSATRDGQVRDDLPRVVHRPRRPPPGQALRQAPAQAGHPHRLPQQDRPGLGHQPPAVSGHGDPGSCVRYWPGSPGRFPVRGPLRTVRASYPGTRLKQAARASRGEVPVPCAGGPGARAGRKSARGESGHFPACRACRGGRDSWRLSPCG